MRIPPKADPETQQAMRELWAAIDRISGPRNVDWHGRRIVNAGQAVDRGDYITKGDLEEVEEEINATIRRSVAGGGGGGSGSGGSGGGSGGGGGGGGGGGASGAVLSDVYPVGTVYISSVPTNPVVLFGMGIWELFAEGRVLVGIDTGRVEFDTVLETGGEMTHVLTAPETPCACP